MKSFRNLMTLAVMFFVPLTASHAALVSSYDFNGNLADTLGSGLNMGGLGGTLSSGRYYFSNNQGLRLTPALQSTTNYGIEIKMQVNDSVERYNKIIDFQDLASDKGLYVLNGQILFVSGGSPSGGISLNNDFILGLSRTGSTINVFLNNNLIYSGSDGGQAVSASNILNFFKDDYPTGQNESFAGSVDFIRLHNDSSTFGTIPTSVPVPAAAWLLGSGLLGLIGVARRKVA